MGAQPLRSEIFDEYLADLNLGGSDREFVTRLDARFNQIYEEAVERYYQSPPWDMPGVQLAVCCYLAWGEVRSVETFTRQAVQIGFERPRLRLLLSKQIYEEMVHHQMFREAAIKMGGVDPLRVPQPAGIMEVFDRYESACGTGDILEKIFYAQFCSERAVIPSYERFRDSARASRKGLHPSMEQALARVIRDEPGHVYVGRVAALELARRGPVQRARMVKLAADIITHTVNLWKKETQDLPSLVRFAAGLAAASLAAKLSPRPHDDYDWQVKAV